jgi:hypothetical protein
MTDKERVKLYSEVLFGAYSIIALVCLSYYLEVKLTVNQFEKCDIFHVNAPYEQKCSMYED